MPHEYQDLGFFKPGDTFRLLDYSGKAWRESPPDVQQSIIDEIFDYYRNRHGFPYPDLSGERIRRGLSRLWHRDVVINDAGEISYDNTAIVLCTHFFPHVWRVKSGTSITAWDAFHDDDCLKDAIHLCLRMRDRVTPNEMISTFSLGTNSSVRVVSRFKPMAAKAVWERYAPSKGVVYDYACGWGGRLLGAMSSRKKLTYIGVDPEPPTYDCLVNLGRVVANTYQCDEPIITRTGSESYCPPEWVGRVDVAFSSPPFFNLEWYSDHPSQSHIKYPTVDRWVDGYLRSTFECCFNLLKPGGYFALNLTDYKNIEIVDQALLLLSSIGFVPVETLKVLMVQRRGHGHSSTENYKSEPVYVWQKPSSR